MVKKIVVLGVALIMGLGLFSGCGSNDGNGTLPYNARAIHLFTDEPFREEFLVENRIANVSYDVGDDEPIPGPLPATRTFIVLGQNEYEQIFLSSHLEIIDFQIEMLVICTFGYSDSSGNFLINSIDLNGETLRIYWKNESAKGKSGNNAMIPPRQRWIVLQMDKLVISSAEISKI